MRTQPYIYQKKKKNEMLLSIVTSLLLDSFGEISKIKHLCLPSIGAGLDVLRVDLHLSHIAATRLLKIGPQPKKKFHQME